MAVNTEKSVNITNIEADPIVTVDKKKGELKYCVDTIEVTAEGVTDVGDIILCGAVPSNAVVKSIKLYNDTLDGVASLAADVGLYYSGIGGNQAFEGNTSGTVVDADAYGTAIGDLQAAQVAGVELRFEVADIANAGNEAWQDGGLAADPGGLLYIGLTVTTGAATPTAGTVTMQIEYLG